MCNRLHCQYNATCLNCQLIWHKKCQKITACGRAVRTKAAASSGGIFMAWKRCAPFGADAARTGLRFLSRPAAIAKGAAPIAPRRCVKSGGALCSLCRLRARMRRSGKGTGRTVIAAINLQAYKKSQRLADFGSIKKSFDALQMPACFPNRQSWLCGFAMKDGRPSCRPFFACVPLGKLRPAGWAALELADDIIFSHPTTSRRQRGYGRLRRRCGAEYTAPRDRQYLRRSA